MPVMDNPTPDIAKTEPHHLLREWTDRGAHVLHVEAGVVGRLSKFIPPGEYQTETGSVVQAAVVEVIDALGISTHVPTEGKPHRFIADPSCFIEISLREVHLFIALVEGMSGLIRGVAEARQGRDPRLAIHLVRAALQSQLRALGMTEASLA